MSHKNILTDNSTINQFFLKLFFSLYFSVSVLKHIEEFINASVCKGYNGTVTDIVNLSLAHCHRTTFGKFLSDSVWRDDLALKSLKKFQIDLIYNNSSSEPIFNIYDDTIAEKTKPSLQAKNSIQQTAYHYSHLDRKQVWGHQLFTTMLSCEDLKFPYSIERYEKDKRSKIDMVCGIVEEIPIPKRSAYGLCDSWFTCGKVIKAHLKKGYHLIGALKTNRIIYPQGIRMQINKFIEHIERKDCHLVTVNNKKYLVYRYEGKINGLDNAVILICFSADSFKKKETVKGFLCTDTELETQTILEYYSKRWPIETFFQQTKANLGLDKYQVRSTKSIDRLLLLIAISYTYCVTQKESENSFSKGMHICRDNFEKERIRMIYSHAQNGVPIEDVFELLKVA